MQFFQGWLFYALLSALFAALTNIFVKIGVQDINSNMATWIRVVVLVVVLTPLLFLLKQWVPPQEISKRNWVFLVLSGLASGASWMAFHHALQRGNVSLVGPVDKLSVALVIIFGVLVLGEELTLRRWIGVGLLVTAVGVIAWPTRAELEKYRLAPPPEGAPAAPGAPPAPVVPAVPGAEAPAISALPADKPWPRT